VSKDGGACVALRVAAMHLRAQLAWRRGDREHSASLSRRVQALCAAASQAERGKLVVSTNEHGDVAWRSMGGILAEFEYIAGQHLSGVEQNWRAGEGSSREYEGRAEDEAGEKLIRWPLGPPCSAEEEARHHAMLCSALRVRSIACAACGAARAARPLQACTRCGLVWYCSPECQKAHWKAAHKAQCRRPKDFRAGDIVSLLSIDGCQGLAQELVGHVFIVERLDAGRAKWWVIQSEGLLHQGASVHERCIQRLLVD
jgi:MYND finger